MRGTLSSTHRHTRLVVVDCTGTKGMSGGPVVSERGVIGMIASGRKTGVLSAVSVESILNVLKESIDENSTVRY